MPVPSWLPRESVPRTRACNRHDDGQTLLGRGHPREISRRPETWQPESAVRSSFLTREKDAACQRKVSRNDARRSPRVRRAVDLTLTSRVWLPGRGVTRASRACSEIDTRRGPTGQASTMTDSRDWDDSQLRVLDLPHFGHPQRHHSRAPPGATFGWRMPQRIRSGRKELTT